MENLQQDQLLGHRNFDCVTPDFVLAQIKDHPILCQYWIKNTEEIQNKLIEVFLKTPSSSDCPGYIYGFRNKKDYNSKDRKYEIKMGRTKLKNPQERIFQWQKQDGHEYVQIFTVRSQHNMKLQALVHILFAYARKTIIINNKRRIQWFEFDEKVPTAAATNILNLLMERIHQKDLQKAKSPDNIKFKEQYHSLLKSILSVERIFKEKRRFAIFGLPKTGKTIISHILSDNQLKVIKDIKKHLQITSQNKINSKQIIQLRPIMKNDKLQSLKNYFLIWFTLCNSQSLIPLLIIKQSDVQSSILSGFTQGIRLITQFIQFETSPIIVINHVKNNFNQSSLKEILVQNQSYVDKNMIKFMQKGEYVFIPQAKHGNAFPSQDVQTQLKQKLITFNENQKNPKIKMNVLPEYNKICHEIIDHLYPKLQKVYSQKYKKQQQNINDQLNLLNLIKFLQQNINNLKTNKFMMNRQVFINIKHINDNLDFNYEQDIQSYLYVFCQCTVNKTLNYTLIFNKIIQNLQERRMMIKDGQNKAIQKHIKFFQEGLQNILQKYQDNSFLKILNDFKYQSDQNKIHYYLNMLINFKFNLSNAQNKKMSKIFLQLQELLIKIEEYGHLGLTLLSTFGRIKEVIFLAVKTIIKKQYKKPQQQLKYTQKIKDSPPTQKISNQIGQTKIFPEFKIIKRHQNMLNLVEQIKKYKEGETIVNVYNGQFKINHSFIIKNHIYVLAKKIVVQKDWKVRFASSVEGITDLNLDIELVFIAESWVGVNRLTAPKMSKGTVYVLKMVQGKIETVDIQNSKHVNGLKKSVVQNLKQLFLSKII